MDGFEVAVVPRGMQALEKAKDNPPDVFLIDFNLHDIEGTDLVAQLRKESKFANTPIVMASGMDVEEKAMSAGANRFLIKPFEPNDLAVLFTELINSR